MFVRFSAGRLLYVQMKIMTDGELLERYVRERSESAFAELVNRHISLVYSAALRQVNGDAHLAEDVTQSVFADLARKAGGLRRHTSITAWLYTSARFITANVRRTEQRRTAREQQAFAMNAIHSLPESDPDWTQLSPLLDDAMHKLDELEREAVLLRHFENHSYAEVGAKIGLTENAARMRVDRALEKLHSILSKQGSTLTVVALAGLLAARAVVAAPPHLSVKIVSHVLAGAAAGGAFSLFWSGAGAVLKSKLALVGAAAVLLAGAGFFYAYRSAGHSKAADSSSPKSAPLAAMIAAANSRPTDMNATASASHVSTTQTEVPDDSILHLKIVAADSGKPIPMVPIDYRGWVGGHFHGKQFVSDRFGECNVDYPSNITELELTTRKDGFADTRLLWRPPNGETIPTNYLLRIDWPVAIGGQVVDADGHPVAGAKVGWNHQDDLSVDTLPQSHQFIWIETTTDENGRWRINRIAKDMIPLIYGSARHPDYAPSALIFAGQDKGVEKQLRDGTFVFKLGRVTTITGDVVNEFGEPVPDAKILVGTAGESGRGTGRAQSDGSYSVRGCPLGKQLVTASANGFAPTTIETNLSEHTAPIQLVLKPGKTLRLRVVDAQGNPIPKASIWYDCLNPAPVNSPHFKSVRVQLDFDRSTDQDGRVALANAPDCDMRLTVRASGFQNASDIYIRPDDQEHVITLSKALVVHGEVTDAATGKRIPKFRIIQGWPVWNPVNNTTNVEWSSIARFWLDFSDGTYSKTFEEPVVGGPKNPGYFLKFTADGYQAYVSRVIQPDEGDVELNVPLQPARQIDVSVYTPDGHAAVGVNIGLVFPGARLALVPGGFSRTGRPSPGALLCTDDRGNFMLASDPSVTRVIAAGPAGYAEATPAELEDNPVMQLQPWGRLEATCYSGGRPVAGRDLGLKFGGGSRGSVSFDPLANQYKTDANGQIVIDQLPPGKHALVRLFRFKMPDGVGWSEGDKTTFEIQPGQTTKLDVGISNYTVVVHLQFPAGMSRDPAWRINAGIHTPMPPIPPEIRTNRIAMTALWQSPEFKAAQERSHSYGGEVSDDGIVSFTDVAPGDYQLVVSVVSRDVKIPPGLSPEMLKQNPEIATGKPKAWAQTQVTVPADPPSKPFDLGIIQLKPASGTP